MCIPHEIIHASATSWVTFGSIERFVTHNKLRVRIVFGSIPASALGMIGPVIGAIMHEVAAVQVIANAATLIGRKSKKL